MEHDDYEYGDACPECGHDGNFSETCAAHGTSYFDDDGNVQDFDWELFDYPLYVECPECNTVLMDKLPE